MSVMSHHGVSTRSSKANTKRAASPALDLPDSDAQLDITASSSKTSTAKRPDGLDEFVRSKGETDAGAICSNYGHTQPLSYFIRQSLERRNANEDPLTTAWCIGCRLKDSIERKITDRFYAQKGPQLGAGLVWIELRSYVMSQLES